MFPKHVSSHSLEAWYRQGRDVLDMEEFDLEASMGPEMTYRFDSLRFGHDCFLPQETSFDYHSCGGLEMTRMKSNLFWSEYTKNSQLDHGIRGVPRMRSLVNEISLSLSAQELRTKKKSFECESRYWGGGDSGVGALPRPCCQMVVVDDVERIVRSI
jgi:hypothetical protein